MDRYQACFERLQQQKQGAFVPFVTIGDPSIELSLDIIRTLVQSGADALELGLPFSDPLADGPTIQGANLRALQSGATINACFELLSTVRSEFPDTPIGLLVYANLVYAKGVEHFYQRCAEVGVDSVLVADVPTGSSEEFVAAATLHGIKPIFIAPPTASDETLQQVATLGQGYTYLLSRAGVTGTETKANMPVGDQIEKLNRLQAPPALLGFGISEPSQVSEAIAAGAAGAISGSAVVKIIEKHQDDKAALLASLSDFISRMKAATQY